MAAPGVNAEVALSGTLLLHPQFGWVVMIRDADDKELVTKQILGPGTEPQDSGMDAPADRPAAIDCFGDNRRLAMIASCARTTPGIAASQVLSTYLVPPVHEDDVCAN